MCILSVTRVAVLGGFLLGGVVSAQNTEYYEVLDIPVNNAANATLSSVLLEDFNLDGNLDIFVMGNNSVFLSLSNGDGTYSPVTSVGDESHYRHRPLIADFDSDGYPDVMVKGKIYINAGDGTLQDGVEYHSWFQYCRDPKGIDVNNDGRVDVLCQFDRTRAASNTTYGIYTFINRGDLSFAYTGQVIVETQTAQNVWGMAQGDINNDGLDDLVQPSNVGPADQFERTDSHAVTSFPGTTNGFESSRNFSTTETYNQGSPWDFYSGRTVVLSDINNDGNSDLIVLVNIHAYPIRNAFVAVYPGDGEGNFNGGYIHVPLLENAYASDMDLADVNADGNQDLIISYPQQNSIEEPLGVTLSYGNGDGTFSTQRRIAPNQKNVFSSAVGDIDGDGQPEVVALSGWTYGHLIVLSTSPGDNGDINKQIICESRDSDTDEDGWGWENGKSCRVNGDGFDDIDTETKYPRNPDVPLCGEAFHDSDGDGWGWKNGATCQVDDRVSDTETLPVIPFCESLLSDSDEDGWGWENNKSCRVRT